MSAELTAKIDLIDRTLYRDSQGLLWRVDPATRSAAKAEIAKRPYLSVQSALTIAMNQAQPEPARI